MSEEQVHQPCFLTIPGVTLDRRVNNALWSNMKVLARVLQDTSKIFSINGLTLDVQARQIVQIRVYLNKDDDRRTLSEIRRQVQDAFAYIEESVRAYWREHSEEEPEGY